MIREANLASIFFTLADQKRLGSESRVHIDTLGCQDPAAPSEQDGWLDFRLTTQLHASVVSSQQMMELGALMLFLATRDKGLDADSIGELLEGYGFPATEVDRFMEHVGRTIQ